MGDWSWFERLMCRMGFHSEWNDTVGHNVNTDPDGPPVYFMETITRCHRCDWQNPRAG